MKRWILCGALALLGCDESNKSDAGAESESDNEPDGNGGAELLTSEEVERALGKSGFDVSDVVVHDEDTDPNELLGRPGQYVVKVNFKVDGGDGSIEVYEDVDGAIGRKEYIDGLAKKHPVAVQYIYLNGTAVLRVPNEVKPKDAKRWKKWFSKL